jgi:enoyl-CoA hydratase/carnithine racemase
MSKVLNIPVILSDQTKISFPAKHVLLITLNRPDTLNAMTPEMAGDITRLMDWFDNEPELWYVSLALACKPC